MSDHEETDTGYSTPVPELDDHRHQTASIPRSRSRRGTVDTMRSFNGRNTLNADLGLVNDGLLRTIARDFEEAVIDEESAVNTPSPAQRGVTVPDTRSRRGTVTTIESRSISPPNSVKAFADARRRERELSNVEAPPAVVVSEARRVDGANLRRTISSTSRWSQRSRRHGKDNDGMSMASNKSAEDDVCYPLHENTNKDSLSIDFEVLEDFIADEEIREEAAREALRENAGTKQSQYAQPRVFPDVRPQKQATFVTSDGGLVDIDIASHGSSTLELTELRTQTNGHGKLLDEEPRATVENRFEFFSSVGESTIHAAEFGDLVLPGEDVRTLFTLPEIDRQNQEGVWWLNMNDPTVEEIRTICKAFGVHPLTIEDISTQEAREKIELFPSYYFASFRTFTVEQIEDGGQEYEGFNVYVIVFREGTLSFSFSPNNHAANVRKRITMLKDYVSLSSDWICYAMIDDIVDGFAPIITKIERESDDVEDEVFIARTDDMQAFLRKIGKVRKNVMGLMKLLGGKADVLRGFTKRCNANYKVTPRMDIGLYLGDIQDHVVTMMSNLGHFEKMLSRSHSNYLAALSIDNLNQGNRANEVLSKITLLASVLVPLNLVCGLFGMNVHVPFEDSHNLNAWIGIVAFLLVFVIAAVIAAKRMRYF